MSAALSRSACVVSAQASRVTNGSRCCRSESSAMSFNCIARRQIGREKHFGMSSTLRTGRVLKASGDQGRFVDASAAVLSRELMRARFELPIQNVIKVVMVAVLVAHPHGGMVIPRHLSCQRKRRIRPLLGHSASLLRFEQTFCLRLGTS